MCLKNTTLYKKSLKQINDINLSAFDERVQASSWLPKNEPDVNIDYENLHNKLFNISNELFPVK